MSEANKQLVRRWYLEGLNTGNLSLLDEMMHPDVVFEAPPLTKGRGLETAKQYIAGVLAAFPGGQVTIHESISEGDKVVSRFTFTAHHEGEFAGAAPTGKRIDAAGMSICRIAEGRVVEFFDCIDVLGMLIQIGAAPGSTEANKALVGRFYGEVMNKGDLAVADEIIAEDFVFRAPPIPDTRGREASKQFVTSVRAAFPDVHYTVEAIVAEGDLVAARWSTTATHKGEFLGIAATGKPAPANGTNLFRISEGKIVELTSHWDAVAFLQNLQG